MSVGTAGFEPTDGIVVSGLRARVCVFHCDKLCDKVRGSPDGAAASSTDAHAEAWPDLPLTSVPGVGPDGLDVQSVPVNAHHRLPLHLRSSSGIQTQFTSERSRRRSALAPWGGGEGARAARVITSHYVLGEARRPPGAVAPTQFSSARSDAHSQHWLEETRGGKVSS